MARARRIPATARASVKVARTPSGPATWTMVARVGEFADALAAAAAGRAKRLAVADDADFGDAPLARQRHGGDRARLGADALGIGGVLDIAAGIDRAAGRAQRGADLEARIGRVGVRLRGLGRGEQLGQRGSALFDIGNPRRPRRDRLADEAGEQHDGQDIGQRLDRLHRDRADRPAARRPAGGSPSASRKPNSRQVASAGQGRHLAKTSAASAMKPLPALMCGWK